MPDLPGAAGEPYDRRFVKWMIKNKVGWVLGPDSLMKHLRTVHQNSIYHCATQGQVRGRGHVRGGAG